MPRLEKEMTKKAKAVKKATPSLKEKQDAVTEKEKSLKSNAATCPSRSVSDKIRRKIEKRRHKNKMEEIHAFHEFEPIVDENTKILILGTFPSVKSREMAFYYGHPQNRFWRLLAELLGCEVPVSIEEKKGMLYASGIGIWDVIKSCDITGSSDSSIKNVVPADIQGLLEKYNIQAVFANGKLAEKLYKKYILPDTGVPIISLPSTSPANAAYSLERLKESWGQILSMLES